MRVGVDVALVRNVVAVALDEADELDLPTKRPLAARPIPCIRTFKGDISRARAEAREVVEAAAAPAVVGLPREDGDLNQHFRVPSR